MSSKHTVRVGIVGGRKFKDWPIMEEKVTMLLDSMRTYYANAHQVDEIEFVIVSGGAPGADKLAEDFAEKNGLKMVVHEPDWRGINHPDALVKENKFGKYDARAGFRRNQQIVDDVDELIAFWDGRSSGTKDTIDRAIYGKVPVHIFSY